MGGQQAPGGRGGGRQEELGLALRVQLPQLAGEVSLLLHGRSQGTRMHVEETICELIFHEWS